MKQLNQSEYDEWCQRADAGGTVFSIANLITTIGNGLAMAVRTRDGLYVFAFEPYERITSKMQHFLRSVGIP